MVFLAGTPWRCSMRGRPRCPSSTGPEGPFPARQSLENERGRLIARARPWRPTPYSPSRQASESTRCHDQACAHVPAPVFHEDSPFGPRRVTHNSTGYNLLRTWSGLGQVCGQALSTISSHTAPDSVRAPHESTPNTRSVTAHERGPSRRAETASHPGCRHGESNPGPPACKSPTTERVGLHRAPSEVPKWPAVPVIGPCY